MANQNTKNREIKTYPPDKYKALVQSWAELNEISQSKVASIAIKQFFDTLPADQRQRLISIKSASKHSY